MTIDNGWLHQTLPCTKYSVNAIVVLFIDTWLTVNKIVPNYNAKLSIREHGQWRRQSHGKKQGEDDACSLQYMTMHILVVVENLIVLFLLLTPF